MWARNAFGRLAMGALPVVVLSGVALTPLWSARAPLESMEAITSGWPWAWMLRGTHLVASTALLIAAGVHTLRTLLARRDQALAAGVWWRSVALIPLLAAAALGGFAMRGDAEAAGALQIWRGVLQSLPWVGDLAARLSLGVHPGDLGTVALHHAGTFTLLVWLLSSEHGQRLWPDVRSTVVAAGLCLALAALLPLSLGPAPGQAAGLALGPWFLLGLQGALRDLPVWAGWVGPLALVALIGGMRGLHGRARSAGWALLGLGALAWIGWSVRLLLFAGAA